MDKITSHKARAWRWTRIAVGFGAAGVFTAGFVLFADTSAMVQAMTPWAIDLAPKKIAELKKDVVVRLMRCEGGRFSESDGIIIFDTNKEASIGRAQFQRKTVIYYYKKLYGQDITPKEAIMIALDDAKAAKLAEDIIFEADGLKNWLNCANKLGLAADVQVIRSIEQ
jgi:hypothetical protein